MLVPYGAPDTLPGIVPHSTRPDPRRTVPTSGEMDAMLAVAPPFLRFAILTAAHTGTRTGSIVKLGPAEWDGARLTYETKKGHRHITPVSAELANIIRAAMVLRPSAATFIEALHGVPLTAHLLSRWIQRLRVRVGIKRQVTLHDMRRGLAHRVYAETRDLAMTQKVLGHSSPEQTQWYLAGSPSEIPTQLIERLAIKPFDA